MIRWYIWTAFVVAWSIALEAPVKDPGNLPGGGFIMSNPVLVTKSLHVGVYAFMTVLSAWVHTPLRYRWLMIFFLMGHATGSELLQYELNAYFHRSGELRDVGFDNLGILIGAIVSWKWWTRPDADCPPSPPVLRGRGVGGEVDEPRDAASLSPSPPAPLPGVPGRGESY